MGLEVMQRRLVRSYCFGMCTYQNRLVHALTIAIALNKYGKYISKNLCHLTN